MPFIPYNPANNTPGNQDFQRGWNMIMTLYGQRAIAEREQRLKDTFKQEMDLREKTFNLTKQNKDLENQQLKIQLGELERIKKQKEQYFDAIKKEREAGTLTPQRNLEIWQEMFPEKATEFQLDLAKSGMKTPNEIELRRRANLGDPEAKAILAQMKADKIEEYQQGRKAFASVPVSSVPGIQYDRLNQKFFEVDKDGNKIELSAQDVHDRALRYKEQLPTNDIRVMQQSVPSVMQLIGQTRTALNKVETGPLVGRWKEFWSGKVGAADPAFRKLRTDINLLQTRLMKMHVGARGSEYIMKHFEELLNAAKDSPENMQAALDEIEMYAKEVATPLQEQPNYQMNSTQKNLGQPDYKNMSDEELLQILEQ